MGVAADRSGHPCRVLGLAALTGAKPRAANAAANSPRKPLGEAPGDWLGHQPPALYCLLVSSCNRWRNSSMRNDLGYFKTSPAVPTHFTSTGWVQGPSVWKGKVLKANGMRELPGRGNRSKAFLVEFHNKNGNNHIGMVQRVRTKAPAAPRRAKALNSARRRSTRGRSSAIGRATLCTAARESARPPAPY